MTVHDPSGDGRQARARFGAAFMSDTKWRKLFAWVQSEYPDLRRMRVKFIDVAEARAMQFPPGLHCPHAYIDTIEFGPTALRAIEWLEFEADFAESLTGLGRYPAVASDGRTKIIAYGNPRGHAGRPRVAPRGA